MKRFLSIVVAISIMILPLGPSTGFSAQGVGSVVQLRGTANILRPPSKEPLTAKLKSPLALKDTVETGDRSRAKMLFIDESILTLSSNSRASIEKFVYSLEGRGASIFNLLDGTMRAVVGKTEFEVHTPTIVAAARGTVIEFTVGEKDGVLYTIVVCLEGSVTIKSKNPPGEIVLNAGEMIIVFDGMPMPEPWAYDEYPGYILGQDRIVLYTGFPPGKRKIVDIDDIIITPTVIVIPPIDQDPPETTPVTISVEFP